MVNKKELEKKLERIKEKVERYEIGFVKDNSKIKDEHLKIIEEKDKKIKELDEIR